MTYNVDYWSYIMTPLSPAIWELQGLQRLSLGDIIGKICTSTLRSMSATARCAFK